MRYVITYIENGETKIFYTHWFDAENNFNASLGMVVIDIEMDKYTTDGVIWLEIEEDHL